MVAAAAPDARSSCALTAVSDHSGLSANRAGVLNAQSWRLIIVWLEVRAPRSLAQLAAKRAVEIVAQLTHPGREAVIFMPPMQCCGDILKQDDIGGMQP